MPTDINSPSAAPASAFICPQCQKPVEVQDVVCPACGVDLAWAAALAERQVLAFMPAPAGKPFKGDILLPRFGEYLLQRGHITEAQLSAALIQQREAALRGVQQTIGQTLFEIGAATRKQLDIPSIEQVRHLQDALQVANRQLEHWVADRSRALQEALQPLAALGELKSNRVGNVSHSLRSPVESIREYGSMRVEGRLGPLADSQREALKTILRCANQLATAINEVGQFAANLKRQVRIRPTRLTVPELVDRLILFFAPKAAAAQTRLRLDVAHGTHSAIESQPERGTTVWFELPVMSAPEP